MNIQTNDLLDWLEQRVRESAAAETENEIDHAVVHAIEFYRAQKNAFLEVIYKIEPQEYRKRIRR